MPDRSSCPTARLPAALALVAALAPTSAHANQRLDDFAVPFPPITLPGTTAPGPYLWAGRLGADRVDQMSATNPIAIAGRTTTRVTSVKETTGTGQVIATLDGHGVLDYATGPGPSGSLTLEYGPRASSPQDLHLDLSGDGATAFTTDLVGDLDASRGRTVALTVTVRSGTTTASCTRTLGADGLVRVPFSCFSPAIAFTRIDYVKLVFDASAQWGIDFDLVGGIATAGSPR